MINPYTNVKHLQELELVKKTFLIDIKHLMKLACSAVLHIYQMFT